MRQNAQICRQNDIETAETGESLLTMRQVAHEAKISLAALYRMRKRNYGPRVVRLDGAVRVSRAELKRWLDSHTERTAGELPPVYQ